MPLSGFLFLKASLDFWEFLCAACAIRIHCLSPGLCRVHRHVCEYLILFTNDTCAVPSGGSRLREGPVRQQSISLKSP